MDYSTFSRHDYKHIPIIGLAVKPLAHDEQHAAVIATHIRKITNIIEMVKADYT